MNMPVHPLLAVILLWLLVPCPLGAAEQGSSDVELSPALVTEDVLEAKVTETEADPDLDDEAKSKLVALYREALSNLKEADANGARAEAFEGATGTATEQTRRIRARIDMITEAGLPEIPDIDLDLSRGEIERRLEEEQAGLAAADARRADFERQLAFQENRPTAISQRLSEAREQQEAIAAALQAELAGNLGLSMVRAQRWRLETRYAALSNEIKALDQELLSLPMRLELLAAKRDQEAANAQRIGKRVEALKALVNAKRGLEAEKARAAAEQAVRATTGSDPLLVHLAQQNAELTEQLNSVAARLAALDAKQAQSERLAARIAANYKREQAAKEVSGLTAGLGQLLLEHRESLPDFKAHARLAEMVEREIAAVNVSRLRHLDEADRVADLDQAVAELAAKLTADREPHLDDRLHDLVEQRRGLLAKQLEAEEQYLEGLAKLQTVEGQLLEAARAYDDFLKANLFWLRTGAKTHLADVGNLPEEARRLFSPSLWSQLAAGFHEQVSTSPVFWLALLVSAVLSWKRRALIAAIEGTSRKVGKPASDRFAYTLQALILSLTTAMPVPLLLAVVGWRLLVRGQGTDLSHAVGLSLLHVAMSLFVLLALRVISIPRGLAIAHFRWPESGVRRLAFELGWLTWVLVPASFVGRMAMDLNPVASGGLVTRLAVLVATLALALFLYRVLHRRRGVLAQLWLRPEVGLLLRAHALWFPILVAFPLVVLATLLGGYVYSMIMMASDLVATLWWFVAMLLVYSLVLRWLMLLRQRLAYRAATERRQAMLAAREAAETESGDLEAAESQSDYTDVDLDAVTDDTRELLRISVAFVTLAGLYLIWSSVLPALGILDEMTLWHTSATVDGQEQMLPVSLADLGLALLYIVAMTVLAKRLPAVLDVILLERFHMSSGSRYTVTALTTYAVITVGTLLALNTIGAQWSQLQWLVAALGVGIGFGLQEIVANFISGLIILFERPVRVGDMVTVGETDGVVTKIRIRATTIRNLDRKELLVPNKEFITGRLLNWSLSDQVTRVMIVVGVAYGTDVEKAHDLMREAAQEHERVLDDPKPSLSFEGFGDNSLTLILRAFIDDLDYRIATITDLHKAINRKFERAGISIAFPQRDLHLDTREPLRVTIEDSGSP